MCVCRNNLLGYCWRRNRAGEVDHIEQASSIECHLIQSGMLNKVDMLLFVLSLGFFSVLNLVFYCNQVSLLAEYLEKWEKDDNAELVIIKVSSNDPGILNFHWCSLFKTSMYNVNEAVQLGPQT